MTAAMEQTMTDTPAEWLNRPDAAKYLGVAVKTLAQWAWLKEGPRYAKYANTTRYRRADLDKFVESRFVEVS
ncbi:helix-turn-helix transcriptional regulator [Mycolicibacterium gilvum]|uniref:Helix-turn-helix domain-containing protein n=1 Tax=Mycolicibacterium gilvum (strain DSM 45189 / LMG 24558 / Spyr1) TaxID=278137 RepID=E6TH07_MYCSR|nr:helix-turn-helix domain-containing protein [Mycolicibacterium gilvum]ADT97887.1 hypothetical protein Mspyr1_12060 [Mycolicibacterium gilvum Spyr1]